MARICAVCSHEKRAAIDKVLASGTVPAREIARQFGLNRGSVDRHRHGHLLKAIEKQVHREAERHLEEVGNVWETRLHKAYGIAEAGVEQAMSDPRTFAIACGFLGAMNKSIEHGLKATGVLGEAKQPTVHVEQIIVFPQGKQEPAVRQLGPGEVEFTD